MALLTAQTPGATGVVPSYTGASATDTFVPDDRTFIYVKNTNGATRTVTVGPATAKTARGQAIAAMVSGTVAATTGEMVLGPFPADQYADGTTGLATITPSATTGVTYAVVRLSVL